MTIDLTPELEAELQARAQSIGKDAEGLVLNFIRRGLATVAETVGGPMLSELMQGRIGLFDSRTPGIAERSSELFAEGAAGKYRRQELSL